MSGNTTTTDAAAIKAMYEPELQEGVVRENSMTNGSLFPVDTETVQGGNVRWIHNYAGTDNSTAYTEGDALPSASNDLKAACFVAEALYVDVVKITGKLLDDARNGYYNVLEDAFAQSKRRLFNTINTGIITLLEASIDNAGSYAGQTRATINTASYEVAVSGALSIAALQTMYEALRGPTYRVPEGMRMVIASEVNQIGNYTDVSFVQTNRTLNMLQTDTSVNGGLMRPRTAYNDWDWIQVNGMTNTTILAFPPEMLRIRYSRPVTITPKQVWEDAEAYEVSCGLAFYNLNPRLCGKLTAVTA
jgi:hypothetical protein